MILKERQTAQVTFLSQLFLKSGMGRGRVPTSVRTDALELPCLV